MSPRIAGTALVLLAATLFGTLSLVSRTGAEMGLGTLAFVTWRAGLAAVVMGGALAVGIAAGRTRTLAVRQLPRSAIVTLLTAALMGALLNVAIFAAFQRVTVAVALIVFYSYPALVTLGAVRFLGERLDGVRAGALVLASLGLVLVVLAPGLASGGLRLDALGLLLAAVAAISQSVFVLVSARGYSMVPVAHAATFILCGSAVIYLALVLPLGALGQIALPFADGRLWPVILAAAITGAAIPTSALLGGIRLIGPSRAAILMTLEPVVGVALAAAFLAEEPHPVQLLGGALVLTAGLVLQGPRGQPQALGSGI